MDANDKLPTVNLEELEKLAIPQALAQFDGNRTKAARVLGIDLRTLQRKIKQHGAAKCHAVPIRGQR